MAAEAQMAGKVSPVLMSREGDVAAPDRRGDGWMAWARGRHRYAGILTVRDGSVLFRGMDVVRGSDVEERIPLAKIAGISLGVGREKQTRARHRLAAEGQPPLVIRYERDGTEETGYFVTNYPGVSRRLDGNRYWFDILSASMGGVRRDATALSQE